MVIIWYILSLLFTVLVVATRTFHTDRYPAHWCILIEWRQLGIAFCYTQRYHDTYYD